MATQINGAVSHDVHHATSTTLVGTIVSSACSLVQLSVWFFQNLAEGFAWAKESKRKSQIEFPYLMDLD